MKFISIWLLLFPITAIGQSDIHYKAIIDTCGCPQGFCCEQSLVLNAIDQALLERDSVLGGTAALTLSSQLFLQGQIHQADSLIEVVREQGFLQNNTVAGEYYADLGFRLYNHSNFDSAQVIFQLSLEAFKKTQDSFRIGSALSHLSSVYAAQKDRVNEVVTLLEVLNMANRIKDTALLLQAQLNLAQGYLETGDLKGARKYFTEAKEIIATKPLGLEPNVFIGLADLMAESNKPDSARHFYQKTIEFSKVQGKLYVEMYALNNLALLESQQGNSEVASSLFEQALNIQEEMSLHQYKLQTLSSLALVYADLGNTEQALSKANEGYALSDSLDFLQGKYQGATTLCFIYEQMKAYEQAYNYQKIAHQLGDSINKLGRLVELDAVKIEYETEKKEKENTLLKLENQTVSQKAQWEAKQKKFVLGSLVLTVIVLAIVLYLWVKLRKKSETLKTQKKTIEEQKDTLADLDRAKSTFFVNISHELKTPLTLIKAPLEQILQHEANTLSSPTKKAIDTALQSSKRISALVNEILDLSKLESGKLQLQSKAVVLSPMLERFFHSFDSLATARNINYTLLDKTPEDLHVKLDIEKVEHIFNNLVSNALKFAPKEGNVDVHISWKDDRISIHVSDNGPGISDKESTFIFDRFYQGKHQHKSGGTGIGLAYSFEIAKLLGGELSLEKQDEPGTRMKFTCLAPSTTEDVVPHFTHPNQQDYLGISSSSEINLLLVEDNLAVRQYMSQMLGQYYNVHEAENGIDALSILEKRKIDLITADVMMPKLGGVELLQKIKQKPKLKNIPFVLVTARADEELKLESLRIGVDDFINKPFSPGELLARLNALIVNVKARSQETEGDDSGDEIKQNVLAKARSIILENLETVDFKIPTLAQRLGTSERSLQRIIKKETGLTPTKFVNEIKLLKAQEFLMSGKYHNVSDVAYAVGFESLSYFSRIYKERFGKLPKEYFG